MGYLTALEWIITNKRGSTVQKKNWYSELVAKEQGPHCHPGHGALARVRLGRKRFGTPGIAKLGIAQRSKWPYPIWRGTLHRSGIKSKQIKLKFKSRNLHKVFDQVISQCYCFHPNPRIEVHVIWKGLEIIYSPELPEGLKGWWLCQELWQVLPNKYINVDKYISIYIYINKWYDYHCLCSPRLLLLKLHSGFDVRIEIEIEVLEHFMTGQVLLFIDWSFWWSCSMIIHMFIVRMITLTAAYKINYLLTYQIHSLIDWRPAPAHKSSIESKASWRCRIVAVAAVMRMSANVPAVPHLFFTLFTGFRSPQKTKRDWWLKNSSWCIPLIQANLWYDINMVRLLLYLRLKSLNKAHLLA